MPEHRPSRGRVNRWRGAAFLGGAIFFLGTFVAHAQDVAEAARQEQARKAAEANAPKHVYTEEDLKKDRILTPDDQARVAARKQQHPVLAQESADKQQPAAQATESESLGTTARRYRNEKEELHAVPVPVGATGGGIPKSGGRCDSGDSTESSALRSAEFRFSAAYPP